MQVKTKRIRVCWSLKEDETKVYHGSWYPAGDRWILNSWIKQLSELYPIINHWIEEGD